MISPIFLSILRAHSNPSNVVFYCIVLYCISLSPFSSEMIYNTELSFSRPENTSHNIVIYPFSETRDDIFRRTRSVETEGVAVRLIVIINRNWEGRVASHVSRANGLRFLSRREKILNFKIF